MNTKHRNASATTSVYPGTYTPMFSDYEKLIVEIKKHKKGTDTSSMNFVEYADFFKVELAAPGVKKEDILVFVKGSELMMCVLPEEVTASGLNYHVHQVNAQPLCKVITIPGNVDSDFIITFYEEGLLIIYLPKSGHVIKKGARKIVVY